MCAVEVRDSSKGDVMPSLNKVFLAGNLTRDPELRYTPGGTAVAQFGLAVNRRFRNREGQMQEEATFIDIEVWARQAETTSEYLSKGSPVLIEGRLKLDTWQSKQTGERRSKICVVGERVQFLGSRKKSEARDADSDSDRAQRGDHDRPQDGPPPKEPSRQEPEDLPPNEEIPF